MNIDENFHVIVKAPEAIRLISLNCFILGDDPKRIFTVEIENTKNVSILRGLIKKKNAHHLSHIAASDLDLWKVDCPIDDLPSKNPTEGPKLRAEKLLLDVFPSELSIYSIHVIARAPAKEDDAYKREVRTALNKNLNRLSRDHPSPSDTAQSLRDLLDGDHSESLIHLGGVPAMIFNSHIARLQQRLNNLEDLQVSPPDIERAAKRAIMFHEDKANFRNAIKKMVNEAIGDEGAWGVAHDFKKFIVLVLEPKNTLGLSGDALLLQAIFDYSKIISQEKYKSFHGVCNFPIVLVGAAANSLEISVAVFVGHIYVTKLLILDLSLGFHASDNMIHLARVFQALSDCCKDLKTYYETVFSPLSASFQLFSLFPNPTLVDPSKVLPKLTYLQFLSRVGRPIASLVNLRNKASAMYTATLSATNHKVIVKFTARYNELAHRLLADAQLAPTLHFCERVIGGLYMVVMDLVDGKSVWKLQNDNEPVPEIVLKQVEEAICLLHSKNIVFGDLRIPNILYVASKDSGKGHAVLVDFDWAGEDGKSRYPASLNTDLRWAEEVVPYGIMRKAHDLWQLERLIRVFKTDA